MNPTSAQSDPITRLRNDLLGSAVSSILVIQVIDNEGVIEQELRQQQQLTNIIVVSILYFTSYSQS